jgi:tripartite-type tricarboxylate transporter receptor subunit TctC
VSRISQEIAGAIKLPDVREFMAKEGADPVGSTPQEFGAFFKAEVDRYAQVIKSANIRAD